MMINKIIKIFLAKENRIYVLLLIIIAIISHFAWFSFSNIIDFGDQIYFHEETLKEFFLSFGTRLSFFNFGVTNPEIYNYPIYAMISSFLANLGFNSGFILNITFLVPIAVLGFISPYLLSKKLIKIGSISFFVALFYGSTTNFLIRQNAHSKIAFFEALAPLIFLFFIRALENKNRINWVYFILIYTIGIFYEFRIAYLLSFVLIFYYIIFYIKNTRFYLKSLLYCLFSIVLLNVFWLFPILAGSASDRLNFIINRSLENNFQYNIINSFIIFNYTWTEFTKNSLKDGLYLWLIPLISFSSLLFLKTQKYGKYSKEIFFFTLITLIGIIVTKQAAQPFPGLYQFLRDNVPGFMMFRSAYKIYFVLSLGYLGLLSYVLVFIKHSDRKLLSTYGYFVVCFLITLVSSFNLLPSILQKFDMNRIKIILPDYEIFNEFILGQDDFFRTLEVPRRFRWIIKTDTHPNVSIEHVFLNSNLLDIYKMNPQDAYSKEKVLEIFDKNYSDYLFDLMSVKYITVPPRDLQYYRDFWEIFYKQNREKYVTNLDGLSYLKRLDKGKSDLIIYENKGIKPEIFAYSRMALLDSPSNLEKKFVFMNNSLNADFLFTLPENSKNTSTLLRIDNPLENVEPSQFSATDSLKTDYLSDIFSSRILYLNKKHFGISADFLNRTISISLKNPLTLSLNGKRIDSAVSAQRDTFGSFNVDPLKEYYISDEKTFFSIKSGQSLDLGDLNNANLFDISKIKTNIVQNGSFELGSWQNEVSDCNHYDANALLKASLNKEEKTDGTRSLQLEAMRHVACVAKKISIKEGGDYLFSFDYQSSIASQAGYYLAFNDDAKTTINQRLPIRSPNWQTYARKVSIPDGATSVSLYLYAYETDGVTNNINRYDNVSFGKLEKVGSIGIPKAENFEKISVDLEYGKNTFEYKDDRNAYANIVIDGSFEVGSWTQTVQDCNKRDDDGLIAMNLDISEKTDGNQSLQLEALRHVACTAQGVPVKGGSTYLVSFDYQSPNAKDASYYIGFNDEDKTSINERLPIVDKNWHSFSKTINIPDGATALFIYFYAREIDGKINVINRYDNVKIVEISDLGDAFYLVSEPQEIIVVPKVVTFDFVVSTKRLVHVKGATTPFFLAMSESYHDQWQLQVDSQKVHGLFNGWWPFAKPDRVADEYHYKLDGFLNAWYVDVNDLCVKQNQCKINEDGSYDIDMVIEFWPQRWFYLGLLISGTTLAGCLGYLGFEGVRSIRRRIKEKKQV